MTKIDSKEAALIAARAADDKKAENIVIQEVRELIGVTDYFVIITASNNRQVYAIIEEIEEKLLDVGLKPVSRELADDGSWSLLDYGDFIVHVFQPEARDYYRLESIWNDAPTIEF